MTLDVEAYNRSVHRRKARQDLVLWTSIYGTLCGIPLGLGSANLLGLLGVPLWVGCVVVLLATLGVQVIRYRKLMKLVDLEHDERLGTLKE